MPAVNHQTGQQQLTPASSRDVKQGPTKRLNELGGSVCAVHGVPEIPNWLQGRPFYSDAANLQRIDE
jgi:hypothetical protein